MSSAYALTSSRLGVVGRRRAPTPPLWLHPPRCAAGPPQDNGYVTPMCHPMPPTHHHGISMATVPTVALAEPCHPLLLMPLLPSASSGLHRKHFLPHSCAEKRRQEIHIQYPHIHYLPDKTYCLHN